MTDRYSVKSPVRIKDWPSDERPREKLMQHGPRVLSEAELLALLLGSGTGGMTAVDVARQLLKDFEGLKNLAGCNLEELNRMRGIGHARASRMLAAFELGRRIQSGNRERRVKITAPADLVRFMGPDLRGLKQEVMRVVLLDSGNRVIRDTELTRGTLNASLVHPREVFKKAVDSLAAGLILVHNHPSGEPAPSVQDRRMTEQMCSAGELMGIPVLDHIIIAETGYFSFADSGLLSGLKRNKLR